MLISADLASNKTDILVEKYAELLNSGVPASEILVLVQSGKQKFIEKTLDYGNRYIIGNTWSSCLR